MLTDTGEIEIRKKREGAGPRPKRMIISIEEVKGECFYGYKVGDTIEVVGLKTPKGFCGAAYNAIFPVLFALNFGAEYPFGDRNSISRVTCPDNAKVRFKVRRVE